MELSIFDKMRIERFKVESEKMNKLIHYLRTGDHFPYAGINEKRFVYYQAAKHVWDSDSKALFRLTNQRKMKVIVDFNEAVKILHHFHSSTFGGHTGINATYSKIRVRFRWKGLKDDVKQFISNCDRCRRYDKLENKAPQLKCKPVKEPLESAGIDFIDPLPVTENDNRYVLTLTDYVTKFVEVFPFKTKEAVDVSKCNSSLTRRWGAPKRLLSGCGKESVPENVEIFLKKKEFLPQSCVTDYKVEIVQEVSLFGQRGLLNDHTYCLHQKCAENQECINDKSFEETERSELNNGSEKLIEICSEEQCVNESQGLSNDHTYCLHQKYVENKEEYLEEKDKMEMNDGSEELTENSSKGS